MEVVDLDAVAKALGLDKGASVEAMCAAIEAAAKLIEAQSGDVDKEAEAAKAPEPEPMADEMPPIEEVKEVGLSADAPAPKAEEIVGPDRALEDPAAPATDAKEELAAALMQALGMELPAVLAFVRDHMEALASLAKGETSEAMPIADVGGEFANKVAAASARIAALKSDVASGEKKLAAAHAEIAALKGKLVEGEVDALIRDGSVLDTERAFAVALATKDRGLFDTWYASKGTKVPTHVVAAKNDTQDKSGSPGLLEDPAAVEAIERQLRAVEKDPAKRRELALAAYKKLGR